jgi:two-component system KDP operon response regulator KdpE
MAVLRRAGQSSSPDEAVYNDDLLNVNVAERRIVVNDKEVRLTPKEFKLFALLVQNADRIVTYKMLLEKVWGWEYTDDLDYVRIYIWHLRRKIELEPAHPRYIITEPGVGYRFRKARTAVYS